MSEQGAGNRLKIMHQINNNNFKGNFDLKLAKNVHQYQTRFSKASNYFRQTSTLKTTHQALSIIGPKLWCEIPNTIKSLEYKPFVSNYRKYLIDKYKQL